MVSLRNKLYLIGAVILMAISGFSIVAIRAFAHPSSIVFEATGASANAVTYMTPGTATTTFQLDSNLVSSGKTPNMIPIDSGSMLLQVIASSSVGNLSTIQWQFQFSNDNTNWYGESAALAASVAGATSSQSESTTTITHQWTPGSTATSSKFIASIPVGPAAHERVVFSIPGNPSSTASSSSFYAEFNLKQNPSTP